MRLKADNNLSPIHHQISELVEPHSKIIELGSGKGDLLLKLSSKIDFGVGIDNSKLLIDQALMKCKSKSISNISFRCEDLNKEYVINKTFDIAIASLFFHVIPLVDSINLMRKIKASSDTILIAAFCKPETIQQRSILWLDQKMTNHYQNFKVYKDFGYMDGILAKAQVSDAKIYDTSVPFVKIYKIG